jgi:hypothetical protein
MMPESERLKEDLEYAEKTRKAKPKGKQVFLQKYHHKGAFYAVRPLSLVGEKLDTDDAF